MKLKKLFIGGHKELKRPMNPVDNGLLQRMQEASRQLRSRGKDVTAVLGPKTAAQPVERKPLRAVALRQTDGRLVAHILDRAVPSKAAEQPRPQAGSALAMKRAS